ncbi:hypothetical protein [Fusobacterium polymorphum]|uniref:hypothetical protein n=1 Tax=Fusobacterium nucleatum subsp. polymorphum TaxID=76857 RepID=UPI00300BC854
MQNRDDNNKEISIYELIKKNIQPNGRLEKNFRLLDEELTVLDDGEKDVQCLEYIDIILKISTDNFDEIEKELKIYFKEYKDTILIYRKPLYNYFTLNRDISSLNNIFNFFKKVLTSSKNIFIVKISIIILTILDLKYSDEILENIKILSLSSEFTLLGILFIKKLKNLNVNKEIFELGKKVYAWGKIACVFYLDANTNEIKDWVLEKGYEENILYNFATMTYFDKADIRGRLQKTYLSKTEFAQISFLIDTLVFSKEIIYLDDKEELLMKYLEKAKIFASSEIDYMAIDEIWVFVDSDMWYMGEKSKEEFIFSLEVANKLLKDCEEILNNRIR